MIYISNKISRYEISELWHLSKHQTFMKSETHSNKILIFFYKRRKIFFSIRKDLCIEGLSFILVSLFFLREFEKKPFNIKKGAFEIRSSLNKSHSLSIMLNNNDIICYVSSNFPFFPIILFKYLLFCLSEKKEALLIQ